MEIKARHVYRAPVDSVFKCFGSRGDIKAKHEALGARNIKIDRCDLTDTTLTLSLQRQVPADAPAMLKKFLSEWNTINQTENWSGQPGERYEGDFHVKIHGVPVTLDGKCVLTSEGDQAVNDVTVKVECNIPLVGKKLAAFIAENCAGTMEQEYAFLKKLIE
ncbi:MAG: hypothetical protein CSB48_10845 [Proteobacteria bacterium]|nr:MAG: hypothetical protein CSB48_10845 [Pseudomonadota bacterium]PIE40040.1 MAG: hypothetical protein CSA51_02610 [Gammaproteobacteria bacterium]